jgi:hypothetical protein
MPIDLTGPVAVLEGHCSVEEAEPLLEWLRAAPAPAVDLSACAHAHTAVLQVLLALRPALAAAPADEFLARLCAGNGLAARGPVEN